MSNHSRVTNNPLILGPMLLLSACAIKGRSLDPCESAPLPTEVTDTSCREAILSAANFNTKSSAERSAFLNNDESLLTIVLHSQEAAKVLCHPICDNESELRNEARSQLCIKKKVDELDSSSPNALKELFEGMSACDKMVSK